MSRFKRIMFPVDFSSGSSWYLEFALDALRESPDNKLFLVHIITEPTDIISAFVPELTMEEVRRAMIEEGEKDMREFCAQHIPPGAQVETKVLLGTPYHEILKLAQELKIDLIVIGTHGHTGLDYVLMGSVAEKVVRKAQCPVLVIRRPKPKKDK